MDALPHNPIIESYLDYLSAVRGFSENSIQSYEYDLILFFKYLKIRFNKVPKEMPFENIPYSDIDLSLLTQVQLIDLYAFLRFLSKERDNTDYGRSRKVSVLRSFFTYLSNKEHLLPHNPTDELENPKLPKHQPAYLSLEESKHLLDTIDGRNKTRDYAIITILLNCGIRLSELTGIRINDIKEDTIRVTGKGDKQRTIYLNQAVLDALSDYLLLRKAENTIDIPWLFVSERKQQMSNRAVQHMVKKHIIKAGLDPDRISVHKLRHTAATLMYQYGHADIRSLQQILGHESVATTEIYTHLDNQSLYETVQNNPLASMQKKDEKEE